MWQTLHAKSLLSALFLIVSKIHSIAHFSLFNWDNVQRHGRKQPPRAAALSGGPKHSPNRALWNRDDRKGSLPPPSRFKGRYRPSHPNTADPEDRNHHVNRAAVNIWLIFAIGNGGDAFVAAENYQDYLQSQRALSVPLFPPFLSAKRAVFALAEIKPWCDLCCQGLAEFLFAFDGWLQTKINHLVSSGWKIETWVLVVTRHCPKSQVVKGEVIRGSSFALDF